MQRHVSTLPCPGNHCMGKNHHFCLYYHHCHSCCHRTAHFQHQAENKNTSSHCIFGHWGTKIQRWHGLMSQQLVWPWTGFISRFDNVSHSLTSCLVFQRVSPHMSFSSSLPTLGCTQECDTLPDEPTHRLSGRTCRRCPGKWRMGGVFFPDALPTFLVGLEVWGTWAASGGQN